MSDFKRIFLAALLWAASGCAVETIAHQQPERDANEIIHILGDEGIDAEKIRDEEARDVRFNITVMKDDKLRALAILSRENLPRAKAADSQQMFEDPGMIPTSTQEEARRVVGLEGDIVNQLRKIRRVVDASAKISIPRDDPLRDVDQEEPKPKASIIIHYIPDKEGRPPIEAEGVQQFVAAAHAELRAASVSVMFVPTTDPADTAAGENGANAAILGANSCEKERVIGISVCLGEKKKLLNSLWGALLGAFVLSAMVVISVLRAMRYRKDLTRLTAQVQQLRR